MSSCLWQTAKPADHAPDSGAILVADDEETFRQSTVELLVEEGYRCEGVADSFIAVQKLRSGRYDLLIADINMPGNADLDLLRQIQQADAHLPVILVTGYPTVRSAVDSIRLAVAAYLVKPIEFQQLLREIEVWLKRCRAGRAAHDMQRLLQQGLQELDGLRAELSSVPNSSATMALLALAMRQATAALGQVFQIARSVPELQSGNHDGELSTRALLSGAHELLAETIDTLEATKSAFKSKQLGRLRHRLQVAIDEWGNMRDFPAGDGTK